MYALVHFEKGLISSKTICVLNESVNAIAKLAETLESRKLKKNECSWVGSYFCCRNDFNAFSTENISEWTKIPQISIN